uniref:Uncharacterized protein n=1 Tax=Siphoviridae sp. cti0B23 TaxID=2825619 RepID=A0A8S5UDT8_9CAUD|nr:MAG TPA: hypothetical protein [Siphoviridae sp. cti0B23]
MLPPVKTPCVVDLELYRYRVGGIATDLPPLDKFCINAINFT